ncbi:PH domain-containing protein [Nakamurella sp.]|uniref:PH domain-containing protein n=1 Tax=Nakamurella sp. TaxID=1869182 RepID=UPI003784CC77
MTSRPAPGVPDEAPPKTAAVPATPAGPPDPDTSAANADPDGMQPLIGDTVGERHRLSRRVIAYWRWRWLISLIPTLLLFAALAIVIPWGEWWMRWSLFTVLAVVGIAALVVLPPIRFRVFWYAISPTEIDIQHGIVFIKRSVIPMHRVQSLRVERGPIADHYRMATLRISTAADTLSVSGLGRPEADAVCTRIAELADVADDV